MAVIATFTPNSGTLSIFGDNEDNAITVSRNAAGTILINGGAIVIQGGTATVANTALIQAFGQGGNDVITLDESNGALPRANLFGGTGNDVLTGGSGVDMLFGQAGNDTLLGKGGADFLFGGTENDVLTGGDADDQVFGEAGDDRMIWNPGDDSDLFEGGAGTDTAEVNGGNGAEAFTVTANGERVRFDRVNPAPFSLDIGTTEKIVVNMNGGDDSFSATGNLAALIGVTVDGGTGNDTILGSNGADILLGGDGNDFIDGQQGNDVMLLGAGDDVAQWDPGDGSDVVEGQAGTDTLLFNGSNANETMDVSANGGRARFFRDVANIVMDLNDVEKIQVNGLGGADRITVNDLSGTDVTQVSIDLAGTLGGPAGDGQADTVSVIGTNGGDIVDVFGSGSSVAVVGLSALVTIANAEGGNDTLVINAGGGDDGITATTLPAGIVKLTIDAGAGNDTVLGSQGSDVILGGDGNDFVFGDNGNDLALLGADNDTFQWDPGDGNDTLEGQAGTDTLLFFGSNANENIAITANGSRALFLRDVASVTMDLNDVERIDYRALGGADTIAVGDLSGTDVSEISIDLRGPSGTGDGAVDAVAASGTSGNDAIEIDDVAGLVSVTGLQAAIRIAQAEASLDRLTVNGLAGDDHIDASGLAAGKIALSLNGGLGNDVVIGSAGADLVNGGDGNDTALMGAGDDTFVWNPGDDNDVVEGQAGFDMLLFNGSNAAETIDISANGGRVRFFRDVANVAMDLNDVEKIQFKAQGGSDKITINDLSGTDASLVEIQLGDGFGHGDGQADLLTVNATAGADTLGIIELNNRIIVNGMTPAADIRDLEAADTVVLNLGAGNDSVEIGSLGNPAGKLVIDAGAGDDLVVSGDAGESILGSAGIDTVSYSGSFGAVAVDLNAGTASGGNAQGDSLVGIENLIGSDQADSLTGNGLANRLDGGKGADTMKGGFGDDVYVVDNALDKVVELGGEGIDRIESSVSFSLAGTAVEQMTLAGTAAVNATGNDFDNLLVGNGGANVLDGRIGNDTMKGGAGNDAYLIDNLGDRVIEAAGQGIDTVHSSVSHTLSGNVEKLLLLGTNAIDGTGNSLVNTLVGTNAANVLDGLDGADTMQGGFGNDTYVVDNALDKVVELDGQGFDLVKSSVSYSLAGTNADSLTLRGTAANATGNSLDNILTGNVAVNVLNGGIGADAMKGGAGNDIYLVDDANDLVFEFAGQGLDTVKSSVSQTLSGEVENLTLIGTGAIDGTGNALANTIIGNAGANALDGGLGFDNLKGGVGSDTFVFKTVLGASNLDHITDFSAVADSMQLAGSIFPALAPGELAASAFKDIGVAGATVDANDRIVYNHNTGALFFDADGSGTGKAVQFATLDNHALLSFHDFVIV